MQKTKIEWTDYTWNPIKGLCPVDCKLPDGQSYCYARQMYQRFKWNPKMDFDLHNPTAVDRLHRKNIPNGSKVFVCSTFELFHPKVPKSWMKDIFSVIKCNPKIIFQILTKLPQKIGRSVPDNVWLGVSITKPIEMYPRIVNLYQVQAKVKFISFEPLLGDVGQFRFQGYLGGKVDWIIVGKLTRHGHEYDPKQFWIESIVNYAKKFNTPIFLKDNLKEIWGEPLIQEYPNIAEESISQQNINS